MMDGNGASRLIGTNGLGSSVFNLSVGSMLCPLAPPVAVSQNNREHWSKKHRATQEFKKAAWACACNTRPMQQLTGPVLVLARIGYPPRRQIADVSNAAANLKALIDGMTLAGWWADDKDVSVQVIDQQRWGQLDKGTQSHYPAGFVSVEVFACE
jgi:Holliday junction resolvase RusA-like endonuclease